MFYENSDLDKRIASAVIGAIRANKDLSGLEIRILITTYDPDFPFGTTRQMAVHLGVTNPGVRKALKKLVTRELVTYENERIMPTNITRYLQVS